MNLHNDGWGDQGRMIHSILGFPHMGVILSVHQGCSDVVYDSAILDSCFRHQIYVWARFLIKKFFIEAQT